MLYYLFEYLENNYDIPGAGLFRFISFRASVSAILSLLISTLIGKKIIHYLKKSLVLETVRNLGLEGEHNKQTTPTMGGIIIIIATVLPVLLLAKLENIYIQLLLLTILWLGFIGFLDDYIKVFKYNKEGLRPRFKLLGQIVLGIIVGAVLYQHPKVTIRVEQENTEQNVRMTEKKSLKTTIPFLKDNRLDYANLISWIGPKSVEWAWIIFIPIVILIMMAVSNGSNLTDGMDGLASAVSIPIVATLGLLAWFSGNIIVSDYLKIMYIPNSGEITVFIAAFVGALVGFLWYNAYPAQIFMGDTGSLSVGGVIATTAVCIRKELILPLLCGIFVIETLSVILQVAYFKFTKKRLGQGKRLFLMSPIHHHFHKIGTHESKIVSRFVIVSVLFAVLTFVTLKLR